MLILKYPGNRNSLFNLNAAAFTRPNTDAEAGRVLGRIPANAPLGAMGGMFAMMSGNYEVTICGNNPNVPAPIGVFVLDAAGSAYENTPAVASGKLAVMTGPGSYETDIYETVKEANVPLDVAWVNSIGLPLYVSDFGLLTTENTGSIIVGYVTKAPTANNPFLGFNTVI